MNNDVVDDKRKNESKIAYLKIIRATHILYYENEQCNYSGGAKFNICFYICP